MEANLTAEVNTSSGSVSFELPIAVTAFTPFLFLELIIGLGSNSILLMLSMRAAKTKSNIGIYLVSLAITGLMWSFNIFTLLSLVIGQTWVLGRYVCAANWYILSVAHAASLLLHLVLSYDLMKLVRSPFNWQSNAKRACIYSGIIWITSLAFASIVSFKTLPLPGVAVSNFVCYGLSGKKSRSELSFVVLSGIIGILLITCTALLIIVTCIYATILKELRGVKMLRSRYRKQHVLVRVVRFNGHYKPLEPTEEEKTAMCLAIMYYIRFGCSVVRYIFSYIQVADSFTNQVPSLRGDALPFYYTVLVAVYLLPTINPVLLILANEGMRRRVKELFTREEDAERQVLNQNRRQVCEELEVTPTIQPHLQELNSTEDQPRVHSIVNAFNEGKQRAFRNIGNGATVTPLPTEIVQ